ncbi:Ataxin-3 [Chionoecetes opilio]|uniref:ubiquitinyl hydrolase 1 n=1 Tax=Chionoecetes opilio TaxID=41210 RepID=A0A8J4XQQ9_CHIOP|nr:Ataxin-3 [Chionoecetes opilio]
MDTLHGYRYRLSLSCNRVWGASGHTQEGRLCGQHCLNNLLQGQYFSAVELATSAQQMDGHMAVAGVDTEHFRKFRNDYNPPLHPLNKPLTTSLPYNCNPDPWFGFQPSVNVDDTGMFSVQVLTSALGVDLSLVAIKPPPPPPPPPQDCPLQPPMCRGSEVVGQPGHFQSGGDDYRHVNRSPGGQLHASDTGADTGAD